MAISFRTTSHAVVKCCQLAFNFLPFQLQLDIHTAKFLQAFIAAENSLCMLTAIFKLIKLFAQFDNGKTVRQMFNDSFTCLNVLNT